jgi:hypothetical protein
MVDNLNMLNKPYLNLVIVNSCLLISPILSYLVSLAHLLLILIVSISPHIVLYVVKKFPFVENNDKNFERHKFINTFAARNLYFI